MNRRLLVIVLLFMVTLVNCVLSFSIPHECQQKDPNFALSETDKLDIVYDVFSIQLDDISQLLNGNFEGVVYFGRDTCPACIKLNIVIDQALKNHNCQIYKFDTDAWRNNDSFDAILEKYHVDEIPMLVEISSGGEVLSSFTVGTSDMDELQFELNTYLKGLTELQ